MKDVKKKQIDLFFKELDRRLGLACEVVLVGAAAAKLMGHLRPSADIDFEIRPKRKTRDVPERIDRACREAAHRAQVAIQFSEYVGGWSQISFLDYRNTAPLYRKIGKLTIKRIAPEHWTIGKMARFHPLDRDDLIKLIRKQRLAPEKLARLWGRAARKSPLSLELGRFRDHVLDFLKHDAKRCWSKRMDSDRLITVFKKEAGIQ